MHLINLVQTLHEYVVEAVSRGGGVRNIGVEFEFSSNVSQQVIADELTDKWGDSAAFTKRGNRINVEIGRYGDDFGRGGKDRVIGVSTDPSAGLGSGSVVSGEMDEAKVRAEAERLAVQFNKLLDYYRTILADKYPEEHQLSFLDPDEHAEEQVKEESYDIDEIEVEPSDAMIILRMVILGWKEIKEEMSFNIPTASNRRYLDDSSDFEDSRIYKEIRKSGYENLPINSKDRKEKIDNLDIIYTKLIDFMKINGMDGIDIIETDDITADNLYDIFVYDYHNIYIKDELISGIYRVISQYLQDEEIFAAADTVDGLGVEIITPRIAATDSNIDKIEGIMKDAFKAGYEMAASDAHEGAGVHVHFGLHDEPSNINLLYLVLYASSPEGQSEMEQVSDRTFNEFAKEMSNLVSQEVVEQYERWSEDGSQTSNLSIIISSDLHDIKDDRYNAFNFSAMFSKGTIEVRLGSSTLVEGRHSFGDFIKFFRDLIGKAFNTDIINLNEDGELLTDGTPTFRISGARGIKLEYNDNGEWKLIGLDARSHAKNFLDRAKEIRNDKPDYLGKHHHRKGRGDRRKEWKNRRKTAEKDEKRQTVKMLLLKNSSKINAAIQKLEGKDREELSRKKQQAVEYINGKGGDPRPLLRWMNQTILGPQDSESVSEMISMIEWDILMEDHFAKAVSSLFE